MAQTHAEIDEGTDTIDGLETALYEALDESESADARYQIRRSLQKVQVLRERSALDRIE
jgi:hypothetical protein